MATAKFTDNPLDARRTSGSAIALKRLLQRAQTEVSQLPPDAPKLPQVPEASEASLMVLAHQERLRVALRPTVTEQIGQYREMMNMKMWRALGPVSWSGAM